MKLLLLFLTICCMLATPLIVNESISNPEDKILKVVEQFFEFMETQNVELGDSLMLDETVFVAKNLENGTVSRFTKEDHIRNVASTEGIVERIWDVNISNNDDLASVWTEYDFYVNGVFSHCGTNLFNLIMVNDDWKIAGAVFTVQRTNCPESPLGLFGD